jgi:DNA mismatch repair protein MutS2
VNPKHLATLEYPKILERLASHAAFTPGKELALALIPTCYLSEACQRQSETSQARWLLSVKPEVGLGGARDVRASLQQAVLAAALPPTDLLDIRQTLIVARDLRRTITHLEDRVPYLADMAYRIQECPGLVQEIGRCISDRGDVLDTASPELARLRSEREVAHQRLLDRLKHIVHSPDNSQYLQEPFFTQRQGRYVIPLRAEFKGRIRGIVHDQSASGATLFIEPLATVELNNRWRQLDLDEQQEVHRVLLGLSQRVAAEADHIRWTSEALAEIDLALAKAHYAEELGAAEAHWSTSTTHSSDDSPYPPRAQQGTGEALPPAQQSLKLVVARHPLLDPHTVVPIDVVLAPETHILIITGPNTGGKTVALKTIGLLVAMAQAGLHIPAGEESVLPIFRSIHADIGDEQSIEQSLSTFSAHLTNIVHILCECDRDALVILDELGAGTDPTEGSALARAILEHLRQRGVTTFVATHYPELKTYAHHTAGVVNASVEFDAETLTPTYRLAIGLPGRSNAFAIARRLGLDGSIVEMAQAMVAPEARQTETMLQDIQTALDAARQERQAASSIRAQVETRLAELNQRLARIDLERRDILSAARAEAQREIETMREELRQWRERLPARLPWLPGGGAEPGQAAIQAAEEALDSLEARAAEEVASPAVPVYRGPLNPGDRVWVMPFNALGEVISSHRGEVEVQVGHFRSTVRRNQVELRERRAEQDSEQPLETTGSPPGSPYPGPPASAVSGRGLGVESPGMELDLRGQTSEEGLINLERYLDSAYVANLPWVRVIHGKGSGVLRSAVRDVLKRHPLVSSYRAGDEGEGGEGVTVARLATG